MSEVTNVGVVTREFRDATDEPDPNAVELRDIPAGVEVYEINGPFFFGAAESFKETMRFVERPPKVMILRMRNVPVIDATGLHLIHQLHLDCRRDGTLLILSDVHAQPLTALMISAVWEEIGEDNFIGNLDDALNHARKHLGLPPVEPHGHFPATVAREGH
jgi:SulP family sulfate permease